MRYFFARLGEKSKSLGNFEKILKFFDENSIEKLNFLFFIFFENLLLKIELSEITPFFYNNFFGFGGISPLSLWLRPCWFPKLWYQTGLFPCRMKLNFAFFLWISFYRIIFLNQS